jgi:hypothetical protein
MSGSGFFPLDLDMGGAKSQKSPEVGFFLPGASLRRTSFAEESRL